MLYLNTKSVSLSGTVKHHDSHPNELPSKAPSGVQLPVPPVDASTLVMDGSKSNAGCSIKLIIILFISSSLG